MNTHKQLSIPFDINFAHAVFMSDRTIILFFMEICDMFCVETSSSTELPNSTTCMYSIIFFSCLESVQMTDFVALELFVLCKHYVRVSYNVCRRQF